MRVGAARRGQPPPIIFEAETRPDYMSLTIDPEKIQPTEPPDPRLYKQLANGGYAYIPALEQWDGTARAKAEARRARRRARRAARKARKAADAAGDPAVGSADAPIPPEE
jgi:hypothetical protein